MESLAKFFNHDFKNGDFKLFDSNGNEIYWESSDEFWVKREFFDNILTRIEDSIGIIIDISSKSRYHNKIVEIDGKQYKLKEVK